MKNLNFLLNYASTIFKFISKSKHMLLSSFSNSDSLETTKTVCLYISFLLGQYSMVPFSDMGQDNQHKSLSEN